MKRVTIAHSIIITVLGFKGIICLKIKLGTVSHTHIQRCQTYVHRERLQLLSSIRRLEECWTWAMTTFMTVKGRKPYYCHNQVTMIVHFEWRQSTWSGLLRVILHGLAVNCDTDSISAQINLLYYNDSSYALYHQIFLQYLYRILM